ncbi:acetylajmalan esterase-like [Nicotiana tomentosiformis]|uniref:acetylajmalan esterase-like n=1 Tax=Nicotiana tomentosiformis TaxID=4098 RepID=UPI00051BA535|nr:acetylajmalan esterase-like [Nicotiana tomentosiformis]
MASLVPTSFFLLAASLSSLTLAYAANNNNNNSCPNYEYIFQVGDSLADTGNRFRISNVKSSYRADHFPYGEKFFGKPTGRFSDGRLVIDYTAMSLKLPLLNPYMDKTANFSHGVNCAVAGSTVLNDPFYVARNITTTKDTRPLRAQLRWLTTYLKTTCHTRQKCSKVVGKSLFMFGEFGGNDYYLALSEGKSIEEAKTFVPHIVKAIVKGITQVIRYGAKRIVVPGIYPLGCFPNYLTMFSSLDYEDYDEFGCLKAYNELVMYHNDYLERALSILKLEYSNVAIKYIDYYAAVKSILERPTNFGFDKKSILKACCGIGGQYNYDDDNPCGTSKVQACSDSAKYLHWDGVHLTEKAYYYVAEHVINGISSKEFQCLQ